MSEHDEHRQTSIALPPSGISIVRDARTVFIVVVVVVVEYLSGGPGREGKLMSVDEKMRRREKSKR